MRPNAPNNPGIIPATNNCSTDVPADVAYKIIGMDGGIIMAKEADEEVTAAANGAE